MKAASRLEAEFLNSPSSLRAALTAALADASRLDAAVAFVGRDWEDIIGSFNGRVRLVCWLSSTNTNPHAVAQMIERGFIVRHLDDMHAKVYVTSGRSAAAIIGSANLSCAALAADDALGQIEAGVLMRSPSEIRCVHDWFDALWRTAHLVCAEDIARAVRAWESAHHHAGRRGPHRRQRIPPTLVASLIPGNWVPTKTLERLARRASNIDPADDLRGCQPLVRAMETRASQRDLQMLIQEIGRWTGHHGVYYPAFNEPTHRVRAAFSTLFDRTRSLAERLVEVGPGGPKKLAGFGLGSLTLLLSWRFPHQYPPFNRRTVRFLKDFGLSECVGISPSARQYEHWVAFAQELSSRLRLPTAGHVDRLVWIYTKDLELD